MGYQLKENKYYLIRQIVENKKTRQFKLYYTNEESVIKFTRMMVGTVAVYIYNEETNQRIDKTKDLGRINSEIKEFKSIVDCNIQFTFGHNYQTFIRIYMYDQVIKDAIGTINPNSKGSMYYINRYKPQEKYIYVYMTIKSITCSSIIKNDNHSEQKERRGEEYEKFIGQKYEKLNHNVFYHGIIKKHCDNGIDLIIHEKDSITFVQCKNWQSNEHYKLNQKDIRAFIGDCYMYMFNNNINKKHHFHYIVSDDSLLTKSAEIYIKQNKKLKFKVVPFE